ncbi:MAG: hypothetical protein ACYDBH_01465 [Acidobacteriaceae bacterium]
MTEPIELTVEQKLTLLQREIVALRNDISLLLTAWNTASGILRFVKALAALAFAIASIWALIRLTLHKSGIPHD